MMDSSEITYDIWKESALNLDISSFITAISVKKEWWNKVKTDYDTWKRLLKRDFGADFDSPTIELYKSAHSLRKISRKLQSPKMTEMQRYVVGKLSEKIVQKGERDILVDVHPNQQICIAHALIAVENALYNPGSTSVIVMRRNFYKTVKQNIEWIAEKSGLRCSVESDDWTAYFSNKSRILFRTELGEAWNKVKEPKRDLVICKEWKLSDEGVTVSDMKNHTGLIKKIKDYALFFTPVSISMSEPCISSATGNINSYILTKHLSPVRYPNP